LEQTPLVLLHPHPHHHFKNTTVLPDELLNKMSNNNNNNNNNEKEREKAKQKNIAVIENAIAARNKVLMLLLCSFLFVYQ
jgi:hypothetical protein